MGMGGGETALLPSLEEMIDQSEGVEVISSNVLLREDLNYTRVGGVVAQRHKKTAQVGGNNGGKGDLDDQASQGFQTWAPGRSGLEKRTRKLRLERKGEIVQGGGVRERVPERYLAPVLSVCSFFRDSRTEGGGITGFKGKSKIKKGRSRFSTERSARLIVPAKTSVYTLRNREGLIIWD